VLQWVIDFKQQKWAKSMKKFLVKLNEQVDEAGGQSRAHQFPVIFARFFI